LETTLLDDRRWNAAQRIAFRFFATYFFLYSFPSFVNLDNLFTPLIKWVAAKWHVLDRISDGPNGSGDTTYDYINEFCLVSISLIVSIIWSLADRKRKHYDKLMYWMYVFVRYTLAYILMSYGYYKIFKTQFPYPTLKRLVQPYGDSSPMGLAWTFMGYSDAFNMFTGIAEVLGGVLLLFRRTTTFGALFCMTVISNIVAMNFCYDIPVKLFSLNLLLMTVFVVAPDIKRLLRFFFYNEAVQAIRYYPVFRKRWLRVTRVIVKCLVAAALLWMGYESYSSSKTYGDGIARPALYGIYTVDSITKNALSVPLLKTDSNLWYQLLLDKHGSANVKKMNDRYIHYTYEVDTMKKQIKLVNDDDSIMVRYVLNNRELIVFKDSTTIYFNRKLPEDFLLMRRGFHWVNEMPYNR